MLTVIRQITICRLTVLKELLYHIKALAFNCTYLETLWKLKVDDEEVFKYRDMGVLWIAYSLVLWLI